MCRRRHHHHLPHLGDPALPALVLVHGGAAHSGWWDHIAPQLTSHRVVAPDLSGRGDSGRRPAYEVDSWACEVIGVARDQGLEKPIVFGHSMGGWVAVACGSLYPGEVSAVAVLDSPLHDQPPEEDQLRLRMRPTRIYPSMEVALARFSTLPPQDLVLPYVSDHIAPESLHQVEGGWTWKFDPKFLGRRLPLRDMLPESWLPGGDVSLRARHGDSRDGGRHALDPRQSVRLRRGPRCGPPRDARPAARAGHGAPDVARAMAIASGALAAGGAGWTFREATELDAPGVVALIESAYRGPSSRQGWTTEADLLDGQRTDLAAVRASLARPGVCLLLAESAEGELEGCCQLEQHPGGLAYFGSFAVRPGQQGNGLGRRLLAEAERFAGERFGALRLEMTVIAQRAELIAWYKRRGYRLTGQTRPFPYEDERAGLPRRPDLHFIVLEKALEKGLEPAT